MHQSCASQQPRDQDACGTRREVQRILMELLNQMDGFDQTVNVKVIMATNRADTLDPALLRPGRLDRKIEFPLPDRRQKRLVFQVRGAWPPDESRWLRSHTRQLLDTLNGDSS